VTTVDPYVDIRGENPLGVWTIRVSDQNAEGHSGAFLGWRMTFWGSTVDPTKTKTYTVPLIDTLLPPLEPTNEHPPSSASTLKTYPKPTANLPGDHGTAEGEKHKPAFSSGIASQPTGLTTPTPDEGWFPDMSNLLSGRKWVFGALGIVGAFGIAAAVFFWRRRMARWRRGYSSLGTEDGLAMGIVDRDGRVRTGGVPTKELYDAFGEISDDEDYEDADEPGLRQHRLVDAHDFRASFADDNGVPSIDIYRDEPEDNIPPSEPVAAERDDSNRSATSGDGSWEHASPTR
jgi:kexin